MEFIFAGDQFVGMFFCKIAKVSDHKIEHFSHSLDHRLDLYKLCELVY